MNKSTKIAIIVGSIATLFIFGVILNATKKAQNPTILPEVLAKPIDEEALQIGLAVKKAGGIEQACLTGIQFSKEKGLSIGSTLLGTCPDLITLCTPTSTQE